MGKTVLLTFADRKMRPTLKVIQKEAEASGFFDEIRVMDDKSFEKSYWKQYGLWYKSHPRGFGYWIWKPYFIRRELKRLDEGDILVYLDAGCVINGEARSRFNEYVSIAKRQGIVCFDHTRCFVKQYTKRDLLNYLAGGDNSIIEPLLEQRQLMAGLLVISNQEVSHKLVNEWYDIMHNHPNLVDDSPSVIPNNPEFIEHRHDQSVFTILAYKYKVGILPQKEVYQSPCDKTTMSEYPFWAARRKIFAQTTLWQRIKRKIVNVINRLLKR